MSIQVEYVKSQKMWLAKCVDEIGQVGDEFADVSREMAIFGLGAVYGRSPQKFSRPLGDLLDKQN